MKTAGVLKTKSLTPYKTGSFWELWSVSWPLMLASFSGSLMIFIDRLIVAGYSSHAFVACTAAQPWYWAIEGVLMSVIIITEVLIGRYNGAGKYGEMGPLIWQMLICTFACEIFLIPVIYFSHYLLANTIESLAKPYLQILLIGCPFELAGFGVIGSFFVGRGETKFIPVISVVANAINIILDVWFVYGGYGLSSMGVCGAAWATVISQCVSFIIFLCLFLQAKYRTKFLTNQFRWSWEALKSIVTIGGPNAVASFCRATGWAITYQFLALNTSPSCFMAYSAAGTFYLFMFFVIDGVGKAVGVLCSNFMGAGQLHLFGQVFKQVTRLCVGFMALTLVFLLLSSNTIIRFAVDETFYTQNDFMGNFFLFLTWEWILFGSDIIVYSIQNFLIALAKTKVVLFFQAVVIWGMVLIPTYFLIGTYQCHPVVYLKLLTVESLLCMLIFRWWYRKQNWLSGMEAGVGGK